MKLYLTLAIILTFSPSLTWGQQIYNPTASDIETGNTAGGTGAQPQTSGYANTGFGFKALQSNTTAGDNTAIGAFAMFFNTTGGDNTATGVASLYFNTSGVSNTATGYSAMQSNTTGYRNTATGSYALYSNTSGYDNTAHGDAVLIFNTTGTRNTATGTTALYSNTTGYANTAHGVESLLLNTTGIRNSALGTQALFSNTTGSRNIAIGWGAGNALTTGNDNIALGNPGVANESQTTRIGNTQTRAFIAGIKGVPISGATVTINNAGQLGILASSERYKKDIAPMALSSADIYKLRPVTYHYKADEQQQTQYGLIAEEVAEVYPEIVVKDAQGQVESLQYNALIPMLINELQKQQKQIAAMQTQIDRLVKK